MVISPSRLLVVEDDPNDVELIRLALEDYPFINQMDVAEDGEQALLYLFGQNGDVAPSRPLPRMILLDLKLPKVDGIQVLEAIRQHPRTQNLVVVVMTSSAENQDIEACYELGVNSYVIKPLDFQRFQEVSQQVGLYWMQINQTPRL
ncbi:MAG: response regulator [Thainema sp.]